jgi:hypothetical protein
METFLIVSSFPKASNILVKRFQKTKFSGMKIWKKACSTGPKANQKDSVSFIGKVAKSSKRKI